MTSPVRPARSHNTGWVGWVAFAAMMMLILGIFNAIDGLVAIFSDKVFVNGDAGVVVLDVTAWGWVHLVIGVLVATAGYFLLQGATWARVFAIGLVMLNMITQMVFLPAYPFWSLLVIALDILILWALVVHWDERL